MYAADNWVEHFGQNKRRLSDVVGSTGFNKANMHTESGVMENGLVSPVGKGTPRGGPLSPLLSNLVLDDLDRELERRQHVNGFTLSDESADPIARTSVNK